MMSYLLPLTLKSTVYPWRDVVVMAEHVAAAYCHVTLTVCGISIVSSVRSVHLLSLAAVQAPSALRKSNAEQGYVFSTIICLFVGMYKVFIQQQLVSKFSSITL